VGTLLDSIELDGALTTSNANDSAPNAGSGVNFETEGPKWADRASFGELAAVLAPYGGERRNLFLHNIHLFAAQVVLQLRREPGVLLDFGCGTGRMLRFFSQHGWSVVGTEITAEMLEEARRFGLPPGTQLHLTDGVSIPVDDQSVDLIWVCGVLKYSLFEPGAFCRGASPGQTKSTVTDKPFEPVYRDIAKEMYRVLRPGGLVVNVEVYVDAQPEAFIGDFQAVGFLTKDVRILQRYGGWFERLVQSKRLPGWCVVHGARLGAAIRSRLDNPRRRTTGVRDYLFIWSKPAG